MLTIPSSPLHGRDLNRGEDLRARNRRAGPARAGSASGCAVSAVSVARDRLCAQAGVRRPAGARGPAPGGYRPGALQSAYGLTAQAASAGGTQTIAIVDAYDDPNAEADLGVYRAQFGLSPCTTANGCFRKVDQSGGTTYPKSNGGWAQEISLDLDMASAICPNCKILLVEADNNSFSNLVAAVD